MAPTGNKLEQIERVEPEKAVVRIVLFMFVIAMLLSPISLDWALTCCRLFLSPFLQCGHNTIKKIKVALTVLKTMKKFPQSQNTYCHSFGTHTYRLAWNCAHPCRHLDGGCELEFTTTTTTKVKRGQRKARLKLGLWTIENFLCFV